MHPPFWIFFAKMQVPNVWHPINLPLWYPSKKNISWIVFIGKRGISAPLILIYGKKMNSWHRTSGVTFCSFSEPTASRVRFCKCPLQCAYPLVLDKCIFRKKRPGFCNSGHALEFVPSFPIYGWLTWWRNGFPKCGSSLWRSSTIFQSLKVQPLEFDFSQERLAPYKSLFYQMKAESCVVVPFCKDKCTMFIKKHMSM